VGHGLSVAARSQIAPNVCLEPAVFSVRAEDLQNHTRGHFEHAAILEMGSLADFGVVVEGVGGKAISNRAWNAQWLFGLLSVATRRVCCPLFSFSDEPDALYSLINRNLWVHPHGEPHLLLEEERLWISHHLPAFDSLLAGAPQFASAVRAYTNSHYLPDLEMRVMLLWAGVEGLLGVGSELRRRLALHAALLLGGTHSSRLQSYAEVKRAYDDRSKVVHGGSISRERTAAAYEYVAKLLPDLLCRCIEIGRVPGSAEFDALAVAGDITA